VIPATRSIVTRRIVALSAAVTAVALSQPACALASEPSFFPSSSSTPKPKHTTIKAIGGSGKSAVRPAGAGSSATHIGSATTFPVPASARVHPGTSATTPTTTYVPAGATPLPSTTSTGTATIPAAPTGTPFKSTLNARTHAQRSGQLSTESIVLGVLGALLALGCAIWGLARRRAFEPHWLLSLRHAMAEAGFRASATWAEFADWVRLGH
jgi:hypothetical protein